MTSKLTSLRRKTSLAVLILAANNVDAHVIQGGRELYIQYAQALSLKQHF